MRRVISVALALFLSAGSAAAQTSEAERLIDEGVELRRAGNESQALDRFRRAYELESSPRALGQMGLAAKSLRLWVDAERYLQGALASANDPWIDKQRAALQQALDVVTNNVASLRVETNVAKAKLYVNGRELGELPMTDPARVVAGSAELEVHSPGYRTAVRRETLPARKLTSLRIELVPEPPAPAEPATVAPAPRIEPSTPLPPPEPDTGSDGSAQRTAAWIAGGVGVVGIGVGAYFGLRTLSLKDERDEICPETECTNQRGVDLDDRARSAALVSTIGFGVGVAALGAAAVLWFTAPSAESTTPAVGALLTPQGGAASLRLRF